MISLVYRKVIRIVARFPVSKNITKLSVLSIICYILVIISGGNITTSAYVQKADTELGDLSQLTDPLTLARNDFAGFGPPIFTGRWIQYPTLHNAAIAEETFNRYENTAVHACRKVEQTLATKKWLGQQKIVLREAFAQTQASEKMADFFYCYGMTQTLLDSYRIGFYAHSDYLSNKRQLLSNRIDHYLASVGCA